MGAGRVLLCVSIALAIAGCGDEEQRGLPAACETDEDALLAALESAPGTVRLDGTRPSDCLAPESQAGDVQQVGAVYLAAGAELAAQARRRRRGDSALKLGYLIGAARRGAARTQGIHSELVRRLEQELHGVDTSSPRFRRGERAGRATG